MFTNGINHVLFDLMAFFVESNFIIEVRRAVGHRVA